MFKVIVAGGRDFSDISKMTRTLDSLLRNKEAVEIVSGCARGADMLGQHYANDRNYPFSTFPADWDKYGKSAGYRRNAEMAEYADALVAFWDGESRGTKHMIDLANKNGLEVRVVSYGRP